MKGLESKYREQVIYTLHVHPSKEKKYEDVPDIYAVCRDDNASGIMVFGKYNGKWHPNPSCRELVAHLLRIAF